MKNDQNLIAQLGTSMKTISNTEIGEIFEECVRKKKIVPFESARVETKSL